MDFLHVLKADIENLTFTPPTVEIGLYRADGDSIAIRPAPSTIDDRDMQQGKSYNYLVQFLVHHQDNEVAYNTIEKLCNHYDDSHLESNDGSFQLISFQVTTTPNFVQRTEHGVLYTMMATAELYIGG